MSLLAVVTIAVSLGIGGTFLLVSRNLGGLVERWRGEARVVVYLRPDGRRRRARRPRATSTRSGRPPG